MKAIVENPCMDMRCTALTIFVEILNLITACDNESELRYSMQLLEKRYPNISKYFKYGFGHSHLWVSDLNGVRLIFVEF